MGFTVLSFGRCGGLPLIIQPTATVCGGTIEAGYDGMGSGK
jgi:hypothetical protein